MPGSYVFIDLSYNRDTTFKYVDAAVVVIVLLCVHFNVGIAVAN